MKLSIFLSYAHSDKSIAQELAAELAARNVDVWIDEGELRVGDSLIERISQALDEIHFVVALVSPYSVTSSWCQKELSLAMTGGLHRKGVKVLPLRVGNVEMPPLLRDVLYLDVDPEFPTEVVDRLVRDAMLHNEEYERATRVERTIATDSRHEASPSPVTAPGFAADTASNIGPSGNGTVKWWNDEKGYGFITADGGKDVFVHFSAIQTDDYRTLEDGQRVDFDIVQTDRGAMADNVRPL